MVNGSNCCSNSSSSSIYTCYHQMDQLKNDYDKLRRLKSADEELRAS